MIKQLTELKAFQKGKIVEIKGGTGLVRRLEAMGLRPGMIISKISAQLLRGPVTISNGGRELALGHGIAQRIMVETED
ncbi:ferrous iron transport protein A [bacterium]|nr:ferrous iron transport protein A [bacterium]